MMLAWFTASGVVVTLLAKSSSYLKAREKPPALLYFASPVASTLSFSKARPPTREDYRRAGARLAVFLPLWAGSWFIYYSYLKQAGLPLVARSYVAALPLYFMGQSLSLLIELAWMPLGWRFPPHHELPILARSLSEFWGRRWATWVADWLAQMILIPLRRRPVRGLWLAFAVSGLLHELMLNVPLLLFHGSRALGSMTLFFLLQPLGILLERKLRRPALKRAILWVFVLGLCPLIFNESVLRVFGFIE